MKFEMQIDSETDGPCAVGECLRGKFFDQSKGGYGCYSTFDLRADVEMLPEKVEHHKEEADGYIWETVWHQARWNGIIMRYYWDGDGCLEFEFPDGSTLVNGDCKKDYEWEWR